MRKLILALALLLIFSAAASAQNSTTVTSTVVDQGGVTWAGGNFTFTFVGPAQVTWPGGTFNRTIKGTLDGSGSFSVSLPSNATISPSPTFWTLQTCPLTGINQSCYTQTNLTISGSSLPLTVTPPAIEIIGNSPLPIAAYADAEIVAPVPLGTIYYQATSATAGSYRQCSGLTGNACTTWTNVGASAGGNSFSQLTSGTNTAAAMVVGAGASLTSSGGPIAATEVQTAANAAACSALLLAFGDFCSALDNGIVYTLFPGFGGPMALSGVNASSLSSVLSGDCAEFVNNNLPQIADTGTPCGSATSIDGVTVTGVPTAGQVPVASSSTTAAWANPAGAGQTALFATSFGVVADSSTYLDVSWTSGSGNVTCPNTDCFFTSGQTGKTCWGNNPATGANTLPIGTFTFTSAQAGQCSVNATGSVTATGSFVVGTNDTAGWLAINAAVAALNTSACIIGPNGQSIVTTAPLNFSTFNNNNEGCFTSQGITTFLPTPTYNWGNHGIVTAIQSPVQAKTPQYGHIFNMIVNGMSHNACSNGPGESIVNMNRVEAQNIWVWNWCLNPANQLSAFKLSSPNSIYNFNCNDSGDTCYSVLQGANSMSYITNSYGGQGVSTIVSLGAGAILRSKANFWEGCIAQCLISTAGSIWNMDGDLATQASGNQYTDVFGTMNIFGGTVITASNTSGTKASILVRATGHVTIRDAFITESGTGGVAVDVTTVPGGTYVDNGNVTYTGVNQTALVAANVVPSAGWGSTATVTNLSGSPDSSPTRFSFRLNSSGTGQASNPTATITYPTPLPTTPTWTCKQTGGTGLVLGVSGESGASTTAITLSFVGLPVAGSNYIVTCTGALQ